MFPLRHLLGAGAALLLGIAALVLGIVVTTQIQIAGLAADTRDTVLPVIAARHEISRDVERLILFGEESLNSNDPTKRRLARLSAQTLIYNEPAFRSDPEVLAIGTQTLKILADLAAQRDRRDTLNREAIGLVLNVATRLPADAKRATSTGDSQTDLLIHAMSADSLASLDEIARQIAVVRRKDATSRQVEIRAEVDRLISLRREIVGIDTSSAKTWDEITRKLKGVTDTLAVQAQLQTSDRFSEIQEQASLVKRVGISGLTFLVGIVLLFAWAAHRLFIRPLVQATTGLERALHGENFEPASESMVTEIGSIVAATSMLRESQERLRAAQNYARIGYWELSRDGKATFWSEQMYHIFGLPRAFPPGTETLREIIDPNDYSAVSQAFQHSIADGMEHRVEYRIRRHNDGAKRWIECRGRPLIGKDALPDKIVGFIQDITERKQAEDELKRYRDSLEETVQQRTAELRLARDAAEAANKAKSVFLANMSHELRTPLNAILGFSSMMRREPQLTGSQVESLDIINRSGEHLLALINDVLEMAKIEAGRLQLEVAPFDLGDLTRDVADMMRLRAEQKGLYLQLDQTSAFPRYIQGDEARLRQILVNLVGNAVKFTQEGGVTLRLGVKHNSRQHLLIEVEDTGPGIDPQDQERIFKPFVQLAEGAEQKGTGLGLTITKQFVDLMNGGISVESRLGEGSLFRVDLPVELADPPAATQAEQRDVVALAPGQRAYRILVAEDQRDSALLLQRLMSDIGMETKVAENGEQCVQVFREWHPDLIWMDRRMPVMEGPEATRRIRQLPDGGTVKIVAVTASAFKEQRREMLDAGMNDFVSKPYRFTEIYDCLARQLGLKFVYRSTTAEPDTTPDVSTAAALPAALDRELRDALDRLDSERIAALLEDVEKIDARLAAALSGLGKRFDYPAMVHVLDQIGSPGR